MKNYKKIINEQGLGDPTTGLFKDEMLKRASGAGCFVPPPPKPGQEPLAPVVPKTNNGKEGAYRPNSQKFKGYPHAFLFGDFTTAYYSDAEFKNKLPNTPNWGCVELRPLIQNSLNPELINFVDSVRGAGTADIYNYGHDLGNKKVDGSCTLTLFAKFLEENPEVKNRVDVKSLIPKANDMYIWVCKQGSRVSVDRASIQKVIDLGYHECTDLELSSNLSNIMFYSEDGKTPKLLNGKKYCKSVREDEQLKKQMENFYAASRKVGSEGTTKEACRGMIDQYHKAAREGAPIIDAEITLGKERVKDCLNNQDIKLDGFLRKKFEKMVKEISYFPIKTAPGGRKLNYRLSDGSDTQMESRDLRIKNLIRENLVGLSESKKKILTEEFKIIQNRLSIIKEGGIPKTKKQQDKVIGELVSEMFYLHQQGFNQKLIVNEMFDIFGALFGRKTQDSIFQTFKEYAADWIIRNLTPLDPDGWIASVIETTLGNIPIGDWINGKVFKCDYISDALTKGIIEGAVKKVSGEKGLSGGFYDLLRNRIIESLNDTEFGTQVENFVGDLICPKWGEISNKVTSTAETMKDKALSM